MANDQDIKIGIHTAADTAGAQAASRAVGEVAEVVREATAATDESAEATARQQEAMTEAAENAAKAQAQADAQAAKQIQQDREKAAAQAEQARAIKELELATKSLLAVHAAKYLTEVVAELGEMAPAGSAAAAALDGVQTSIGVLQTGLATFISTGNPFAAIGAGAASGLAAGIDAFRYMRNATRAADEAAARFRANLIPTADGYAAMVERVRRENLSEELSLAERAARSLNAELARRDQLAAARAGVSAAAGEASGASESSQQVARIDALFQAMQRSQDGFSAKLENLTAQYAIQKDLLESIPDGTNVAAVVQATAELRATGDAIDELRAEAANQAAVQALGIKEAFLNVQSGTQDGVTAAAADTLAALKAQAQESGQNLSSSAREAIAALEQILADGIVQPEEMARLSEAMARIRASRESADKDILAGLTGLEEVTRAVLTELPAINARINGLMSQIETLQGQQ